MFLFSGRSLVNLCLNAHRCQSIQYYSLLIVAMSIMTFTYAMLVVSRAFYISLENDDDFVLWKFLAFDDTSFINYLFPTPTMLYCLHNYNLLDKAANEKPSKCAKVVRYAITCTLVAGAIICILLAVCFIDENWIRKVDYHRFSIYYRKTDLSIKIINCICYLTSAFFLSGIIYWAAHLRHKKDKIVLKTGNLNRGFICLHVLMILIASGLQIYYVMACLIDSLKRNWLYNFYAYFPIALDLVLCVIIQMMQRN
jgi:hypothetical protein